MAATVFKAEQLNLPEHITKTLKGRKIELIETNEGGLIKPTDDTITEIRGFLQGGKLTTEAYFRQKSQDKELE
ncbi:MAG: hypothetical protein QMC95_13050 [Desulfitobacteriaceae bacterium]|nr:hypothetical protein [Desulfitobacteriaceae bacterium]MDI6915125.1 hypothetical protein [Desulfitobacteriaceae bacterium]